MVSSQGFRERWATLSPHLNERQRRLAAAAEARALGYGGVSTVSQFTGLARGTIHRALRELRRRSATRAHEQIRARGAGRPRLVDRHPGIQKSRTLDEMTGRKPKSADAPQFATGDTRW